MGAGTFHLHSAAQLLLASNLLQLLSGTEVPLGSCRAVAAALHPLRLRGRRGHVDVEMLSCTAAGIVSEVRRSRRGLALM